MLLTATLQSTPLGSKMLADGTSMAEVREKELGEQDTLNKALARLPVVVSGISADKFPDMYLR